MDRKIDPRPEGDAPQQEGSDAPPPGLSRGKKAALLGAGLLALAGGGLYGLDWWLHASAHEATNNAQIQAPVSRVSPRVEGHVLAVHVADNQAVEAGALLAEIDPATFRAALAEAEGAWSAARGRLAEAEARVEAADAGTAEARSQVASARAEADRSREDLARAKALVGNGAVTRQQFDQREAAATAASAALEAALRRVAAAEAEARSARAAVGTAGAEVARAEATLEQARLDLGHTRVTAPIAGTVTQKRLEPGDFMRPGTPVLSLVGRERWVEANFKETQLEEMRPGQPATVTVDAWPGVALPARVESVQSGTGSAFALLPAQNATGNWVEVVQRVPVKLLLDPAGLASLPPGADPAPGMSVEAEVRVAPAGEATGLAGWLGGGTARAGTRP